MSSGYNIIKITIIILSIFRIRILTFNYNLINFKPVSKLVVPFHFRFISPPALNILIVNVNH